MLKFFKLAPVRLSCLLLPWLMAPAISQAANPEIVVTVNGVITHSTCALVNNFGGGANVELGSIGAPILNSSSPDWVWTLFSIDLERCPSSMTTATMTLGGTPDPDNNIYFENSLTDSSAAKNVAVELSQQTGDDLLSKDSTVTIPVDTTTHTGSFLLKARMISTNSSPTPGSVAAHVNFTVDYN